MALDRSDSAQLHQCVPCESIRLLVVFDRIQRLAVLKAMMAGSLSLSST